MKERRTEDDAELAEMQAAMMELFVRQDLSTGERLARIRETPAFAPFAGYFESARPVDVEFLSVVVAYRARRPPGATARVRIVGAPTDREG